MLTFGIVGLTPISQSISMASYDSEHCMATTPGHVLLDQLHI